MKSSNELVEAIKSEMKDCVTRVSRGKTLLELAGVFQVGRGQAGGRVNDGLIGFDLGLSVTGLVGMLGRQGGRDLGISSFARFFDFLRWGT